MKTLKEEVMELLMDRIGVEDGDEFEAKMDEGYFYTYKFLNGNMVVLSDDGDWRKNRTWYLFVEYFDRFEFRLKRFSPKNGGMYWYVNTSRELWETIFDDSLMIDVLNRSIGNCFRTKESAEAHKEEILKILKGEDDE
nr:MAG TPA: hypothetical protein [Caudoviricetes sp.]